MTSAGTAWRLLAAALIAGAVGAVPAHASPRLTLAWTDNSGGQAGFSVERRTAPAGPYVELARQPPGSTTFVDSTVTLGATYCYRVRAVDGAAASGYTAEACASPSPDVAATDPASGTSDQASGCQAACVGGAGSATRPDVISPTAAQSGVVPVRGDFDGDGRVDLAVWDPASGAWAIVTPGGQAHHLAALGVPGDVPVVADYDGDGRADVAVWRAGDGGWQVLTDPDRGVGFAIGWGAPGDVPVPGDYDGDGKADLAVWREQQGAWFIVRSAGGQVMVIGWGAPGDIPVPADYDGDGRTDIAVFRPATGTWFIVDSTTGVGRRIDLGAPGDVPVPGDYDGDGKADVAVWRPQSGVWLIRSSATGDLREVIWGAPGDVPVPADYDGAGRMDVAVWRPGVNGSPAYLYILGWDGNAVAYPMMFP